MILIFLFTCLLGAYIIGWPLTFVALLFSGYVVAQAFNLALIWSGGR